MKKAKIIKYAVMNSLGTAVYIILIASFLYLGEEGVFGNTPSIFVPIAMLMLFVFSAAFTGTLVLGRPIVWYLNGKKREAVELFFWTLGIFLILLVLFFILVFLINL